MTNENTPEMKPELESDLNNNGITQESIEQAIAEAVTPEKPKRKPRKKKVTDAQPGLVCAHDSSKLSSLEGETVPEAIGYCSECAHPVYKGDKTCRGCGARFNDSSVDELVKCPHCGLTIDLEGFRGQFKCPSCGGSCIAED